MRSSRRTWCATSVSRQASSGCSPQPISSRSRCSRFRWACCWIALDRGASRRCCCCLRRPVPGSSPSPDGIELLVFARALIGLGVSACLMAGIKAFVQWFPMSRLASLNGWLLACGGLGVFAASLPAEAALRYTDWRGLFAGVTVLSLLAAAFIFLVVPDRPAGEARESWRELLAGVRTVFSDRRVLARKPGGHGGAGNVPVGADPVDLAVAAGRRRLRKHGQHAGRDGGGDDPGVRRCQAASRTGWRGMRHRPYCGPQGNLCRLDRRVRPDRCRRDGCGAAHVGDLRLWQRDGDNAVLPDSVQAVSRRVWPAA